MFPKSYFMRYLSESGNLFFFNFVGKYIDLLYNSKELEIPSLIVIRNIVGGYRRLYPSDFTVQIA